MAKRQNALTRALDTGRKQAGPNVWVDGRWILYRPTFSPSPEVKEWGGRWEEKNQAYRLPRLFVTIKKIVEYDPQAVLTPDARRQIEDRTSLDFQLAAAAEIEEVIHPDLYPYQREAVRALTTRPFHGDLLTLSPGLGKTPTSIVAGDIFMDKGDGSRRALVVAPLSLVWNWKREIDRWSGHPVEVVHQAPPTPDRSVRWTVTNYDTVLERSNATGRTIVTGQINPDFDFDWDIVIFDESVLLKNRKAKRTGVARSLARCAKRVWLLSGAPATRDYSDLWAQFNIMEPDYFSSFWRFAKEYCVVMRTQWSEGEIIGSRHDKSPREDFPDLMFVRNQEEVFEDLPEYIFQDVELKLHPKQKKAHQDVMDLWLHELEENADRRVEVSAVIAMLTRLQQITSNLYNLETVGVGQWPDCSAKADFVEETLDEGEVEWPVIVWMHHRPGAQALLDRLKGHVKQKNSALYKRRIELVQGKTKNADAIIEDFKEGKVDVLLLGITVGKYGHTLANAHTIITYDKVWDSDAWFQMLHRAAGARAHLAGYHHRPLLINPRCEGTVDDFVELNLAGKLPTMANITGAELSKILRSLGEEHVK